MTMTPFHVVVAFVVVVMATPVTSSGHYTLNNSSCVYEGKTYSDGQEVDTGRCEICTCRESKAIMCIVPYCPPPQCADSLPGGDLKCPDCGRICPNGPNCQVPSGEIIPAGRGVTEVGGKRCHCEEYGPYLWGVCE